MSDRTDIKWKFVEESGAKVTWLHGHGRCDFPSPAIKAWLPSCVSLVEWCRNLLLCPNGMFFTDNID
jgi:hypothetical protein